MSIYEYDEEKVMRMLREEAREYLETFKSEATNK